MNKAYKNLSSSEFEASIEQESELIILDVRTINEFRLGHIPGALNIDVTNSAFIRAIEQLDKTKPVYVYCLGGGRSVKACDLLSQAGFKDVYNLRDGISAYKGRIN